MKNARQQYADIIDLPHYQNPNRRHMSLSDRAAQFAPFSALSGYEDMVCEQSRLTEAEKELSDFEAEQLDRQFAIIQKQLEEGVIPEITVTYFVPDLYKQGGSLRSITALVKSLDIPMRELILYGSYNIENRKVEPMIIRFDRIKSIKYDEILP